MCCKSKQKPIVQQPSKIQPTSANVVGGVQPGVVAQPPLASSNVAIVNSNPSIASSSIGRSRLPIDKNLQKSHVKLQEVPDPNVVNFFKDCKTQRIQLTKVTNEHNSYVRQYDYFDISNGHESELRNLKGLTDVKGAYYGVDESSTLSTPSINKFCYNRNVVDVGFVPKTTAYRTDYSTFSHNQPVYNASQPTYTTNQVQNNGFYSESGIRQSSINNKASNVQPVVYTNNNSTVQPFSGQGQPIGTYSTVKPVVVNNSGSYISHEPGYREVI